MDCLWGELYGSIKDVYKRQEIRSGVYDRLSEGGGMDMTVEAAKGRRIRIYQLKQDSPFMMRVISLAEREKRGSVSYTHLINGRDDTFFLCGGRTCQKQRI